MIDELICMLFGYKMLQQIFKFSSILFENQVKMCFAINLAGAVYYQTPAFISCIYSTED